MKDVTLRGILPQPDPRSGLAYAILAFLIVTTVSLFAMTGMWLDGAWPWSLVPLAMFLIFIGWMLRRAGHSRIGTGLETVSLMVVKASFVLVLQYALVALPFDYKDEWLDAADRFFMFDRLSFDRTANRLLTAPLLNFSYNSLIWQGVALLIVSCAAGRETLAWQIITAAIVALAITTAVFTFFPLGGRYSGCGEGFEEIAARSDLCMAGTVVHRIKDGLRMIDVSMATGLVWMPSFHAAAGAIFVWAGWTFKWLRAPVILLNSLMWIATITVGAHYIVDVPAGIAVAALSIWIAKRYVGGPAPIVQAGEGSVLTPADTSTASSRPMV